MEHINSAEELKASALSSSYATSTALFSWLTLRLIAEKPTHGYEIMRFFENMGFSGRVGASVIYPYLGRFLAEGALSLQRVGRRKVYHITELGRSMLKNTELAGGEQTFTGILSLQRTDPANFAETEAHLNAAVAELKRRGTTNDLNKATGVLARAAAALRRITA